MLYTKTFFLNFESFYRSLETKCITPENGGSNGSTRLFSTPTNFSPFYVFLTLKKGYLQNVKGKDKRLKSCYSKKNIWFNF